MKVMNKDYISKKADEYEEQDRLNKEYIRTLEAEIDNIDRKIIEAYNYNIYNKIYKGDGDGYRLFVEKVAKELRRRDNGKRNMGYTKSIR